jgi:hypothetical protein
MRLWILSQLCRNTLIGLSKAELARTLQLKGGTKKMNQHHHVHPAITACTLVLLALALVGALTALGMLP